jgi:hypothetical protein
LRARSQRFGSGAGFSNYFPQPAYQKKTVHNYIRSLNGTYDGLYNKKGRGYPDVAAQGYVFSSSRTWIFTACKQSLNFFLQ